MKKLILLFPLSLFLLSCEENSTNNAEKISTETSVDSITIPEDDTLNIVLIEEEIEKASSYNLYSDWHQYLVENFDTLSPSNRIIGESAHGGLDICHFEQQFEKGILFKYGGCGEGGANESITFPGFTKKEMFQIINTNFFTEDNTWNEDSTSYEADGAGCYYSIEERNDTLFVSTYCGC